MTYNFSDNVDNRRHYYLHSYLCHRYGDIPRAGIGLLASPTTPESRENADLLHFELRPGGNYCKAVGQFENEFDLVVIDGRDRVNCALNCVNALKSDGVIIWDNSDREKYTDGIRALSKSGFKELNFTGLGPIGWRGWCTSIFYRTNNCLGI